MLDLASLVAPIGIFLGRLANFIKPELWGRPTDVPWAMIFPGSDGLPRHPSQIYEAVLEGLLVFAVLMLGARAGCAEAARPRRRRLRRCSTGSRASSANSFAIPIPGSRISATA